MKRTLLIISCLLSLAGYGQKKDDTTIIVTLPDSASGRSAIIKSFMKNDMVIKDYEHSDTIITYPTDRGRTPGYTVIRAIVSGNVVQLTGKYSHKKVDYFGYNSDDKNYLHIRYYKASKTWDFMYKVAKDTGGLLSYSK